MVENHKTKQTVILTDRARLEADGIEYVSLFDDDFIRLETALGTLQIEGKELKLENLSKESGKILIEGSISCVSYVESKKKKGMRG